MSSRGVGGGEGPLPGATRARRLIGGAGGQGHESRLGALPPNAAGGWLYCPAQGAKPAGAGVGGRPSGRAPPLKGFSNALARHHTLEATPKRPRGLPRSVVAPLDSIPGAPPPPFVFCVRWGGGAPLGPGATHAGGDRRASRAGQG